MQCTKRGVGFLALSLGLVDTTQSAVAASGGSISFVEPLAAPLVHISRLIGSPGPG